MDPFELQKMLDMQCPYHKNHKHSARDCFGFKNHFSDKSRQRGPPRGNKGKAKRDQPVEDEDKYFQVADHTIKMIYGGHKELKGKRKAKLTERVLVAGVCGPSWDAPVPAVVGGLNHLQ